MEQILKTMTVREAAPLWDDPRSIHLKRWGETFEVPLDEFHHGHIVMYEQDRQVKLPEIPFFRHSGSDIASSISLRLEMPGKDVRAR